MISLLNHCHDAAINLVNRKLCASRDPVFLALLRDRIDVREGRPQRYGTQIDGKGNIAPLLDAARVSQWRQEVGLPAIK